MGKRMKLTLALSILGVLSAVAIVFGWVQVYNGTDNGGIVFGTETHNVGYEWRGDPGFFVDGD